MQLWPEGTVAPAHGMEEIVNSAEMWITTLWVLFDLSFLYASQWQSQSQVPWDCWASGSSVMISGIIKKH